MNETDTMPTPLASVDAPATGEQKLVPMEPTEAMLDAVHKKYGYVGGNDQILRAAYRAMLAAAPADAPAPVKPVAWVLMNSDGKMYWDEEECIWGDRGAPVDMLETMRADEPDDGWHIAPLYAHPPAEKPHD